MRVLKQLSEFGQVRKGCVLTIGNFDGVHIGHRELLRRTVARARENGELAGGLVVENTFRGAK